MHRCRRWFSFSFLLILVGFLIPAAGSAETILTQNSPQFRSATQDSQGNLHILWVSEEGSVARLYYQVKEASGKSLTNPELLTENTTRIRRPKVVLDAGNVAHLLWQERSSQGAGQGGTQGTAIRYTKLTLTQNRVVPVFPRPILLNSNDGRRQGATHPGLAVDEAGWTYVIWEEGKRDVVLTAIDPSGGIKQTRQISRKATETDHAEPAVAVDRRGNVHVVWTTQAGNKTQIVYKAFRGHGGKILTKEKIVYASKGSFAQAKVLTFDKQGNARIAWTNLPGKQSGQRGRWAMSGRNAGSGYVLVRTDRSKAENLGSVLAVVDRSFQSSPDSHKPLANEAVVNPKPRLISPTQAVERTAITDPPVLNQSFTDQTAGKLLMERLLRYSSWSGPPPADSLSINVSPAFCPSVLSLSNTDLTASSLKKSFSQIVSSPCHEQYASSCHFADPRDRQTIQLTTATRGGEAKSVLV